MLSNDLRAAQLNIEAGATIMITQLETWARISDDLIAQNTRLNEDVVRLATAVGDLRKQLDTANNTIKELIARNEELEKRPPGTVTVSNGWDLFVSPGGSDTGTGTGTSDKPFATIQKAMDVVKPGQGILIRPGVYNETVVPRQSGEAGKLIRVLGDGAEVDGVGQRKRIWSQARGIGFYEINGIQFSGAADGGSGNGNAAVTIGNDTVVEACTVTGCGGGGMAVNASRCVLRGVIAKNNGRYGIGGSGCKDVTLETCVSERNNLKMWDQNAGGGKWTQCVGMRFKGCIWRNNGGVGLWADYNNYDWVIDSCEFKNQIGTEIAENGKPLDGIGLMFEISGSQSTQDAAGHQTLTGVEGTLLVKGCILSDNETDNVYIYCTRGIVLQDNTMTNGNIRCRDGGRNPYDFRRFTMINNQLKESILHFDMSTGIDLKNRALTIDQNTYSSELIWQQGGLRMTLAQVKAKGFELNSRVTV